MKLLSGETGVAEAARLLGDGECVALPTETVYGLAADASQAETVAKIFTAKQRPSDHPLIVHLASVEQLTDWAIDVPDVAYLLADAFWPGPLTLLLWKAPHVPAAVTGGRDTIAVRIPRHALFLDVLSKTGLGLAAPSANRYKQLSPTTADQVINGMQGRIPAVLDGGPCEEGLESTILDLTSNAPAILRPGPIGRDALSHVIGSDVQLPQSHQVAVPGNVAAHYQPVTPLRQVTSADLIAGDDLNAAYLIWSDDAETSARKAGIAEEDVLKLPADPQGYAQGLYSALHLLDARNANEIRVEATPRDETWAAINDRLRRATGSVSQ